MSNVSAKEYILSQLNMTESDYNHWQKLMRAMTTSARMMGLKNNAMTRQVFNTALSNLINFEKEHHIQFYGLGVSLDNAEVHLNYPSMEIILDTTGFSHCNWMETGDRNAIRPHPISYTLYFLSRRLLQFLQNSSTDILIPASKSIFLNAVS